MDAKLRQMILNAQHSEHGSGLVREAHGELKKVFNKSFDNDSINVCGLDLYIQCAEIAQKLDQRKIAQECLDMYFNSTTVPNQFLCRAYLCQAQLLAPTNPNAIDELETAIVYLLKTIDFCKDKPRYHFLIYNASVLYWHMARPFLKKKFYKSLNPSLKQVMKALEIINDDDHEWRATLMIALIESLAVSGQVKEAASVAQAAHEFTFKNCIDRLKDVMKLQIRFKLADLHKLNKDLMPEYTAFVKLEKLKMGTTSTKGKAEAANELKRLVMAVCEGNLSVRKTSSGTDISSQIENRIFLLVELTRYCVINNEVDYADQCLGVLRTASISNQSLLLQIEFMECEMMVKQLGLDEESFIKSAVDVRLSAIKRMSQALENAVRSGNANVIQGACATQWNLCLPLLQKDLRKFVRRPLTVVAEALEDISSLQVKLRCNVHTEVAKCEEAVEQIEAAVKHVNKAIQLDDTGVYQERLQTMLHRLQLSSQLYQSPERSEDIAAVIIEQAKKSVDSGSSLMKRSLLVKAGLALAPDAFQNVLDSEDSSKVTKALTKIEMLAARAMHWKRCVKKAKGHLKRFGNENDRERACLWVDLVKTARQQRVWDVCRSSATFCLLYDDGRWSSSSKGASRESESEDVLSELLAPSSAPPPPSGDSVVPSASAEETGKALSLQDADLLRMLVEIYFINGEAIVHLLQGEGVRLNEGEAEMRMLYLRSRQPTYHDDDDDDEIDDEEMAKNSDWQEYHDWIKMLNDQASFVFLRAIEIGMELKEPWIVCSGSVYLWNYNNHLLAAERFTELVPIFDKMLIALKKVGHLSESVLLVQLCDVISRGLLLPWIPKRFPAVAMTPAAGKKTPGKTPKDKERPSSANGVPVDPEAADDLKRALEVCEYGLQVTDGSVAVDVVPTSVRHPLVATWVQLKQLLLQQIAPGFGVENEKLEQQSKMTKAMVMIEMLKLNCNHLMKFQVPEIVEIFDAVEGTVWNSPLVELEMWSRLSQHASALRQHQLVVKCVRHALDLKSQALSSVSGKKSALNQHRRKTALEMLSHASRILGESLMLTCATNPSARPQAMQYFVESAKHGEKSSNYPLVIAACRLWWNAAQPLMDNAAECELLAKPLAALLASLLHATDHQNKMMRLEEEKTSIMSDKDVKSTESGAQLYVSSDDVTLRVAMYGMLFQTFANKGEWQEGLKVLDKALRHMPRTKHRLLLFKHRVIAKAKLGLDVQMDLAKFKGESEDSLANMWYQVALCSRDPNEQLAAYQHAIESLHSPDTMWQKFELLLELGAWMYGAEIDVQDCVGVLEWAADILLNVKRKEIVKVVSQTPIGRKGKKGKTPNVKQRGGGGGEAKASPSVRVVKEESAGALDHPAKDEGATDEKAEDKNKVVIGLEPRYLDLNFSDIESSRHLEGLIRSHVMMATIGGRGSEDHLRYILLAYAFVARLWRNSTSAISGGKGKTPSRTAQGPDAAPASGKRKSKATPLTTKEKKRKAGGSDALPEKTVDWAVYDPSDEFKQALMLDASPAAINNTTMPCPENTVNCLLELSDFLCASGATHLSLPVLSLAALVAHTVVNCEPWVQMIRLKQILVCYELHLPNAAQYWESSLDGEFLTGDEQVTSRQMIEMKRVQQQLLESQETGGESRPGSGSKKEGDASLTDAKPGGVNLTQIWIKKARLLLKLGYVQQCRLMLNEALTSVSDDVRHENLRTDLYLALADLSLRDGHKGQAMKLIEKAQVIGGDIRFWQDSITLLMNALVMGNELHYEDVTAATDIARHSKTLLKQLISQKPTKSSEIEFLRLMLNSRTCLLNLSTGPLSKSAPHVKALEKAESGLKRLGYFRELAKLRKEHAKLLVEVTDKDNTYQQRVHLLRAIELLETSVAELHAYCSEAAADTIDDQVSFPLQRELCEVELELVRVLLLAEEVYGVEYRAQAAEDAKKGKLQKLVESYKDETLPDSQSEVTLYWNDQKRSFLHRALSRLFPMQAHIPHNDVMSATWLYLIGRSLRLLACTIHSDHIDYQWEIPDGLLDELKAAEVNESAANVNPNASGALNDDDELVDAAEEVAEPEPIEFSALSWEEKQLWLAARQTHHDSELAYRALSHATDVLAQGLKLSLHLQNAAIVRDICSEMVECTAQCDPSLTSALLALMQSAVAAQEMRIVLNKALADPGTSLLASLLFQDAHLLRDCVTSGLAHSTVHCEIARVLDAKSTTWKRLKLTANHLDLVRELPATFNLLVLQYHPYDQSALYCALVKPSAVAADAAAKAGKGKEKSAPAATPSMAAVCRVTVATEIFDQLSNMHEDFETRRMSFLLQTEYQRSQLALRNEMLEKLAQKVEQKESLTSSQREEKEEIEIELKDAYSEFISKLEECFQSVTSFVQKNLQEPVQIVAPPTTKDKARQTPSQLAPVPVEITPTEQVIILANREIFALPLEVLQCFQVPFVLSVTRDFSLQILHRRWTRDTGEDVAPAGGGDKKKADAKTPKTAPKVPLKRDLPQDCAPVDTNSVHYMVDPHDDCSDTDRYRPEVCFRQLLDRYSSTFTSQWSGIFGTDELPSAGQWEEQIDGCGAFIFFGMERFIAQYPPWKIVSQNLNRMQLALLIDKAQTNKSFRYQSKVDVDKTSELMSIEKPFETAMLLTLSGVNCVCLNQWCTSAEANVRHLEFIAANILEEGTTIGRAVRKINYPPPPPPTQVAGDEPPPPLTEKPSASEKAQPESSANKSARKQSESKAAKKSDEGKTSELAELDAESAPVVGFTDQDVSEESPAPFEPDPTSCNLVVFGLPNLLVV